jgi:hypothetical protein
MIDHACYSQLLDTATIESYTAQYESVSVALVFDGFAAIKHGCEWHRPESSATFGKLWRIAGGLRLG